MWLQHHALAISPENQYLIALLYIFHFQSFITLKKAFRYLQECRSPLMALSEHCQNSALEILTLPARKVCFEFTKE